MRNWGNFRWARCESNDDDDVVADKGVLGGGSSGSSDFFLSVRVEEEATACDSSVTATFSNRSDGMRIFEQHLMQTVRRQSLQLCHHVLVLKTEKRVLRHTKQTLPQATSSLTDESSGRFSNEAAVRTRRIRTSSSSVINFPCTSC